MLKKTIIRLSLASLWVIATGYVGLRLFDLMSGYTGPQSGEPVARVEETNGEILFRPGDSLLWYKASVGQELFENDTVTVPDASWSRLAVYFNHNVILSPGSMIRFEKDRSNGAKLPKVELMTGKIKVAAATVKKTESAGISSFIVADNTEEEVAEPLKIVSGEQEIVIGSDDGDEAALLVDPQFSGVRLTEMKGDVLSGTGDQIENILTPEEDTSFALNDAPTEPVSLALLSAPPPLPVPDILLKPLPPAKPMPKKKPARPVIPSPPEEPSFSLNEDKQEPENPRIKPVTREQAPVLLGNDTIQLWSMTDALWPNLEFRMRRNTPPEGSFVVFLEIEGAGGQKRRVFAKENRIPRQLTIPSTMLRSLQQDKFGTIRVRSGIARYPKAKGRYASKQITVRLSSLKTWHGKPMTLELNSMRRANATRPIIKEQSQGKLRFQIHLPDGRYLRDFYANMSSGFRLSPAKKEQASEAVRFVSKGRQVASVEGAALPQPAIKRLIRVFGAEFAFRGKASDYMILPQASRNRLAFVNSYLTEKDSVNLMSRNRLIKVTQDQMEDNIELVEPVAANASYAFDESIPVVFP